MQTDERTGGGIASHLLETEMIIDTDHLAVLADLDLSGAGSR